MLQLVAGGRRVDLDDMIDNLAPWEVHVDQAKPAAGVRQVVKVNGRSEVALTS